MEDMVNFEKLVRETLKDGYDGYHVMGIKNRDNKPKSQFNDILSNVLSIDDIDLRTPINGMEYGKGIWFDENAMKYMIGGGQALQGTKAQPRSNLVRDIILFDGKFYPDKFFPLLNINFVRHEGYPVLPFPFTILNDAIELQEIGWKFKVD
jgi:hypothetical protein